MSRYNYRWLPINVGRYGDLGTTLPDLIFTDPDYCYWAYENGVFKRELGHQAKLIAGRASHIRPPGPRADGRDFGIVLDNQKRLQRFVVLTKVKPARHKDGVAFRVEHLDLAIIRQFGSWDRKLVGKRLIDGLKQHFVVEGRVAGPRAFFGCDDYFDLCCRQQHSLLPPNIKNRAA